MDKDVLFLLRPGFTDAAGGPWFCPYCAGVEGLLAQEPRLGEMLDVRRIAFARPREQIVALLGEEAQSCPVLALADEHADYADAGTSSATGRRYVSGVDAIWRYLAATYHTPSPHP